AFLTYGTDLTFPSERDLKSVICRENEERSALFNHVRTEILLESWRAAVRDAVKANESRTFKLFKVGDLVVVRLRRSTKSDPAWSTPHRVITLHSQGHAAEARDLATSSVVRVHISDVKFIPPPDNEIQRREWEIIMAYGD